VRAVYDKHHLVPFGEYVPFADYLSRIGLRAMVEQTSGFSSGPGPALLDFGALGSALPLICYEAVFAHRVNEAPARPDFLLQVTNDAWFGSYAGPQQHLAQARMRAIEQGLPLLRSANTGISAVIDPFGRTIAQLALNTDGFVDAPVPQPLPPTLYSKIGDVPVALFLAAGFLALFARRMRRGGSETY
jgi:apolipoprotein N-acyltransferase